MLGIDLARSDLNQAIGQIDRAIKLDPANPWLHDSRGRFVRKVGTRDALDGVMIHLGPSLRLAEAGPVDRLLKAKIHFEMGLLHFDKARKDQLQLVVIGRVGTMGRYDGQPGMLPVALQHIERAMALCPHNFSYYDIRGQCRYGLGEWDAAWADLRVFLAANPKSAETIQKDLNWWDELHATWQRSNEDTARRYAEHVRFQTWLKENCRFCSRCSGWTEYGKTHFCSAPRD